jgi:DNA-3-methyladenine glycosylase II
MSAVEHLTKDKKIRRIIELQEEFGIKPQKNVHLHLCRSIMSQQLSTKVASIIHQRFLDLFEKNNPSPSDVLNIPFDKLKAIGLSNSKTNYIRNVCDFFIERKLTDAAIHKLADEEVIELLTEIKGVGRWTVEMLLMFTLGREDVFALDDLGIQQAMIKLYNLENSDKKNLKLEMTRISKKWSPYRTYACRYLWGWKDEGK